MFSRMSRASLGVITLALYGGPVLAGFAGHGGAVLPVFAALFLLFSASTRKPDLSDPVGWVGLALMAVVQVALVAAAYALGYLLAMGFGLAALPVWAPIALSAAAAGAGAWAFRDAAEMDVMLDSALAALHEMEAGAPPVGEPWPEPSAAVQAAVDRAVAALKAAEHRNVGFIDPIVQALESEVGAEGFDPFYDAAGEEDAPGYDPKVDLGLLRYIASPAVLRALVARGEGGLGPMLLLNAGDSGVRAEARARVVDLADIGAPKEQWPDAAWLAELNASFPGEGYDRLAALREKVLG